MRICGSFVIGFLSFCIDFLASKIIQIYLVKVKATYQQFAPSEKNKVRSESKSEVFSQILKVLFRNDEKISLCPAFPSFKPKLSQFWPIFKTLTEGSLQAATSKKIIRSAG